MSVRHIPLRWRQWRSQSRLEVLHVLGSGPFIVLLLLALAFVVAIALSVGGNRGTMPYPLTSLMLRAIQLGLQPMLVIVVVFFAGELVFREREQGLAEVMDALPAPTAVRLGAKLWALVVTVLVFVSASVLATVAVQLAHGFTRLEPGLYVRGVTAVVVPFILWAVLALFLQVIADRKLVGFLLFIVVFAIRTAMPPLGLEHGLYRWASHTRMAHSDMNGFAPFVEPFLSFTVYWSLAAAVLVILSAVLWVRGTDITVASRMARARARCRGPVALTLALGLAATAAAGGWIYQNTCVLNEYMPRDRRREQRAEYERRYGGYREARLPRVADVTSEVDIFPHRRRVDIRGTYTLVNSNQQPIGELPISVVPGIVEQHLPSTASVTVSTLELDGQAPELADHDLHFFVFQLEPPLAPDATAELSFELGVASRGFTSGRQDTCIVANGTLFANRNYLPVVGYARNHEVQAPERRRTLGLPPRRRVAPIDDPEARQRNYLEADWISLDTTVSTSAEQIAIAPGNLVDEWQDGERRFFRYRSELPMLDLYVYMSADYDVRSARWGDVDIEIYHHPAHAFNVDKLLEAARTSLAYYSSAFGPYPFAHLRIVEVPNYIGLTAFALAGVVPMSEAWGFTLNVGPDDLDTVTHVTAHEIAHQWWNHQVIGGNVQGTTMISEAVSQYAALMVTKRLQGEDFVRHYLRWELDRYLSGRGSETLGERPLVLVENQEHIHYFKGSLAMYALQDAAGEDVVNRALRRFLEEYAFSGPPYPTSRDLLQRLRDEAGPEHEQLIEDLFETITLWDNRVLEATYTEQDDGAFQVRLRTGSRKLRADEHGVETEIALNDHVDIGVFGQGGTTLLLDKRLVDSAESVFEVIVPSRPVRAGIDPFNKLIDRDADDNVARVAHRSE